jgi:hypothetical protein
VSKQALVERTEGAMAPQADMLAAVLSDPEKLAAIPIETVERLIALRERMQAEAARRAYFDALADFQRDCPTIINERTVSGRSGGTLYKFAPLAQIVATIRQLEHQCGFSHRFETHPTESGGVEVACIVTHREGHSEATKVFMPPTKGQNTNASQDMGIQIKYGMRYALIGGYGIVTADTDTDGRTPADDEVEAISEEQAANIRALLDEVAPNSKLGFLGYMKVESIEQIPVREYRRAVGALEAKRRAAP